MAWYALAPTQIRVLHLMTWLLLDKVNWVYLLNISWFMKEIAELQQLTFQEHRNLSSLSFSLKTKQNKLKTAEYCEAIFF